MGKPLSAREINEIIRQNLASQARGDRENWVIVGKKARFTLENPPRLDAPRLRG